MLKQQTKKLAAANKGFTLVELIVVITILAILGTIAFVSFQGQSGDARDATRRQEVDNLVTKINMARANGVALVNLVTNDDTKKVSGIALAGTGVGIPATKYTAGAANYSALGVVATDYKDPLATTNDYLVGATTYQGSRFQVAATIENGGATRGMIKGDYRARTSTGFVASGTGTKGLILSGTGVGFVYNDDWIKDGTITTYVTAVAGNASNVTTFDQIPTVTGLGLVTAESAGLVKSLTLGSTTESGSGVTDNGTTVPYNIQ